MNRRVLVVRTLDERSHDGPHQPSREHQRQVRRRNGQGLKRDLLPIGVPEIVVLWVPAPVFQRKIRALYKMFFYGDTHLLN